MSDDILVCRKIWNHMLECDDALNFYCMRIIYWITNCPQCWENILYTYTVPLWSMTFRGFYWMRVIIKYLLYLAGWDQGCLTMKLGEIAKLTIPGHLGYGAGGFPAWGYPF